MRKIYLILGFWIAAVLLPGSAPGAIINGGFESDLDGWTAGGNTSVSTIYTLSDGGGGTVDFTPVEGLKMANIEGLNGFVTENFLHQDVALQPGDNYLLFSYNFWTYDEAPFDDPAFTVEINAVPVVQLSAGDIGDGITGTLDYTGWVQATVPLSSFVSPDPLRPISIRILAQAGNTGDELFASGVFLDDFRLSQVPVPGTVLLLGSGLLGLAGFRKRAFKSKQR